VAQKMKLKKNDKIILIVGVVILIAAGAGIALYTIEDSDDTDVKEDSNLFSYTWIKREGTVDLLDN
jgi:flagellar basal body-associated protein FliL